MDEKKTSSPVDSDTDVRSLIRQAIQEFTTQEQAKTEPAYKTELMEERKRREQLESRLNELVEENRRSRALAEEAERNATIRAELQRLGIGKIDLAYRAVKDDIFRAEDGSLQAKGSGGDQSLREYLAHFASENPELLPARIPGGSGAGPSHKAPAAAAGVDIDKIKPGMSAEELERVRQEISRITLQGTRPF